QSLAKMETRHHLFESFSGPNNDGTFSVLAYDALKMLDSDRAQAPRASNGFLEAPITEEDTAASLAPGGIGNGEYTSSGIAGSPGQELVGFDRAGDDLNLERGLNDVVREHDTEDRFQLALEFEDESPADIIYDLLVNYAGVDPAVIPLSEWQLEC